MDLLEYIKTYFRPNDENYFHEFRSDRIIVEMGHSEKPIRLVIVAPYFHNKKYLEKYSKEKLIKEVGFGNIKQLLRIGSADNILESFKGVKTGLVTKEYIEREIKLFLGLTDKEVRDKRYYLIVKTGKAIVTNNGLRTFTVEWEKKEKFSAKSLMKRKEIKMKVRIPNVGSSIFYKPDNNDIKAIKEILTGKTVEIASIAEFEKLAKEFEEEGIVIPGFDKGLKLFPYIKIELLEEDETVLEQMIPIIYSLKLPGQ